MNRDYSSSNMISQNTTLGVLAILAASVLVTWALVASPSYAAGDGHKDKRGISGSNNTIIVQKSKGEAIANGYDTEAINQQSNCLTFDGSTCPPPNGGHED